jgi:hypothetical protein
MHSTNQRFNSRKQSTADSNSSEGSGKLQLRYSWKEPQVVLHRTQNRIIVAGDSKLY